VRKTQLLLVGCVLGCGPASGTRAPDAPQLGQQGSAAVVQRQVEAYNNHALEPLLATYSDEVAIQTLPDTLVEQGKARLRQGSKQWFDTAPRVHADILHRTVLGSFVVDHERITGTPDGAPVEAVAIYQVIDGRIQRVWFVPPGQ
jgi:hypothetical protein